MKKTLIALAFSHILGAAILLGAGQPSPSTKAAACEKPDAACCAAKKDDACCKEAKTCDKTAADCAKCAEHKTAAHVAAADACPVSGKKLGSMGDPYTYIYKEAGKPDRAISLCCKMCVKSFEKNPAKYLAKLDAAQE